MSAALMKKKLAQLRQNAANRTPSATEPHVSSSNAAPNVSPLLPDRQGTTHLQRWRRAASMTQASQRSSPQEEGLHGALPSFEAMECDEDGSTATRPRIAPPGNRSSVPFPEARAGGTTAHNTDRRHEHGCAGACGGGWPFTGGETHGAVPYPAFRQEVKGGALALGARSTIVFQEASRGTAGGGEMVVANGCHAYKLESRGRAMSVQEYRSMKTEQRTSQNFWKSEWAWPTGDVTDRSSLLRAKEFICHGMLGCTTGDCLFVLETHDVKEARDRARARVAFAAGEGGAGSTTEGKMLNLLHFDAFPLWNGERFGPMHLRLSPLLSVEICVAAYAFLIGVKGSSAQTAFQRMSTAQRCGGTTTTRAG